MDWIRSGWANNSGIELYTNSRVRGDVPADFGDCIAWIGSGWATECADQQWTNAWICCDTQPVPPVEPPVGGGGKGKGRGRGLLHAPGQLTNRALAMREDEEIIAVIEAFLNARGK